MEYTSMWYAFVTETGLPAASDCKKGKRSGRLFVNTREWTAKIVVRYFLIQVVSFIVFVLVLFLIHHWVVYPFWVDAVLVIAWVVKDVALFPLTWKAYDWEHTIPNTGLVGFIGDTRERLDPEGYIMVRGELWKARSMRDGDVIEKGTSVIVRDVAGLTLLVERHV